VEHRQFQWELQQLHAQIRAAMPATHTPNLFTLGPAPAFIAQKQFTI